MNPLLKVMLKRIAFTVTGFILITILELYFYPLNIATANPLTLFPIVEHLFVFSIVSMFVYRK